MTLLIGLTILILILCILLIFSLCKVSSDADKVFKNEFNPDNDDNLFI